MKPYLLLVSIVLLYSQPAHAKTVRYDLTITQQPVNMSGKKTVDFALQVNGGIPAPTLEFTEGDDAEITVTNNISTGEETSIHWHGILLPPEEDGVSYVNTPPILKGQSRTFKFKIRQHGTYWYHSHTSVQEQKGVYGAFVIHPKEKKIKYDKDAVVVLSDWTDENADQILKNLRKDGDYYLYKKDSIRSYWDAFKQGGLSSHLGNEWIRMGGMDLSDVGYDAFLINGKKDSQLITAHPGERIRLRIINSAASSYFYVSLGQSPMQVISADGIDIEPIMAKEILMGMAETYDVLFTVPEHKNYELRATVQDVTGYASAWIGMGDKVAAPNKVPMAPYMSMSGGHGGGHAGHQMPMMDAGSTMDHGSHGEEMKMDHSGHEAIQMDKDDDDEMPMDHSTHGGMNHPKADIPAGPVVDLLTVDSLKAQAKTIFPKNKSTKEFKLVLGGDMERYVWYINGKAIHEDRNITVEEGDIVRFIFENETMMHHPMHLHGHFFRVVNTNGEFSPLKHTVDVSPHGSRTIEFFTNEPGEWMLHCHNLYHMKTGMARVVKYSTFTPKPEIASIQSQDHHLHDHFFFDGKIGLATNEAALDLRLSKTWDTFEASFKTNKYDSTDHVEGEILYRRWFSAFLNLAAGGYYSTEYAKDKTRGIVGFSYTLPMLIELGMFIDHKGKVRAELEKKFQWTKYLFTEAEFSLAQGRPAAEIVGEGTPDLHLEEKTKSEFRASLMYSQSWEWAAGFLYAGEKAGVGLQYRF